MQVLEEVANCNLLVAGMKAELLQLEKDKDAFFEKRDNEVNARIKRIIDSSDDLLNKVKTNYQEVHEFYENLKTYSEFLSKAHTDFTKIVSEFTEKSDLWRSEVAKQEARVAEIGHEAQRDREGVARDKEFIKGKKKDLENEKKHIESQQAVLKVAYNIMKDEKNG